MFEESQAFSGFSVNNQATAKDFYSRILGLAVEEDTMGLTLKISGGSNIFVYPKEDHTPASFTIINFPVDDINKAVEQLKSKGVELEHYEGMYQDEDGIARGIAANQGPDIAWFKDPAGNILSVLQEK
ncbi:MAG TPA: VOC family protein [Candidatus Limnocylindria bacterium]|nr:VOC family protein [Candidatus Limnocylindria bacterium]